MHLTDRITRLNSHCQNGQTFTWRKEKDRLNVTCQNTARVKPRDYKFALLFNTVLLAIFFALVSLACLFPPWQMRDTEEFRGYAWLWNSPYQKELRLKQREAATARSKALVEAERRVAATRKYYLRVRSTACELNRSTLGGFSISEALIREANARTALNQCLAARNSIEEKNLDWWMESPSEVEVSLPLLLLEVIAISMIAGLTLLARQERL